MSVVPGQHPRTVAITATEAPIGLIKKDSTKSRGVARARGHMHRLHGVGFWPGAPCPRTSIINTACSFYTAAITAPGAFARRTEGMYVVL